MTAAARRTPRLHGYDAVKEAARQRAADVSLSGRDIGEIPKPKHRRMRIKCKYDLRLYCETYHSETFNLPWSKDQLLVISKIEQAVLKGGLFAMAMPRGSGKSSICEAAALWAILYGHRRFVVIIGAEEGAAKETMESIKTELETNELLLLDFPEAVYPISKLERISQRAKGQLYHGKHTRIEWTEHEVVLPTIPKSPSSGAIIGVAGITGRIRGRKYKRPDGSTARPDFALIDDPQTDATAKSIGETEERRRIVGGAILKMAGPGKKIAAVMPCTVIRKDDLADQVLNRTKFPDWRGERTKMLYSEPKNEKLWAEYDELRRELLAAEKDITEATAFYKARMATCKLPLDASRPCDKCKRSKVCMDAGAIVAWVARIDPDEASAIQNAMNLRLQDPESFAAECQNDPQSGEKTDTKLRPEEIASKTNGYERRTIPMDADHVVAYIDVMEKIMFYVVVAWRDMFTGYIVDYGTYPEQNQSYFTTREVRNTLARQFPKTGLEGRLYGGLGDLCDQLLGAEWERDDGAMVRIGRCLIDANWGDSTDVVYQFCRQSPHSAILLPSHGVGLSASAKPFADYKKQRGERVGHHWRIPSVKGKRMVRHVLIDVNYWKSFVYERLSIAMGDSGCVSLFGSKPAPHRLFADHITAEYRVETSGRGRTVDEWKQLPNRDNHWFDCLVGCAVAGSIAGVVTRGHEYAGRHRRKVSFAARYQQRAQR